MSISSVRMAPAEQNIPPPASSLAPDPARGVFETLLIREGAAIELDAHLSRLAASLERLYGLGPPADLGERVRTAAAGLALGRLRIVAAPPAEGSAPARADLAEVATEPVDPADFFPGPERGAELRSLPCRGGLGRHKWADRRPLAAVPPPAVPLLLDGDEVLEAGRANVFSVRRGTLFTPADDGRILPGTARAAVIEAVREAGIEAREGPLSKAELLSADEAFLTGSVRGVEPVRSLDGEPLPPAGEVAALLAAKLRRRWRTGRLAAARP